MLHVRNTSTWGVIFLLASLAGCQTLPTDPEPAPDPIASYAADLLDLQGTALQNEYDAELQAWKNIPSPQQQARLGLVRAVPGHTGFDPELASQDLREALASPKQTTWQAEQRAFLKFQAAQLDTLAQGQAALLQANQEKAQTTQQLDNARSQLEALSTIERELEK